MQWLWMAILLHVAQAKDVDATNGGDEVGVALEEAPLFDPPNAGEVEQRTYDLGKILRCPVCQGLSVADSQSDAAVAMKNRIKELVALGYSDDQIIDYFIGRYGEFVLLQPKSEHWFVWWMPLLGLGVGVGMIALRLRSDSTPDSESVSELDSTSVADSSIETDKYRAQLLAELED
jgi:cytochrome c-type biogenesis protein CcmH